jgi:hypothetical protein
MRNVQQMCELNDKYLSQTFTVINVCVQHITVNDNEIVKCILQEPWYRESPILHCYGYLHIFIDECQ